MSGMSVNSINTRPTLAPYAVDPGIQDELDPAMLQAIAIADLLSVATTGQLASDTVAPCCMGNAGSPARRTPHAEPPHGRHGR